MPADRVDRRRGDAPVEPAWHERTGTLAAASIAALAAIALLYFLIVAVARQFNEPDPAPGYYMDPSGTTSSRRTAYGSSTPTTTTSTLPSTSSTLTTSDINPGDTTTTSSPSSTDATTTDTEPSQLYPPRTRDGATTRSRPRLNQTRTVYPPP